MEKLFTAIAVVAGGIVSIFFLTLLSTFFGGMSLWIIGGVFDYIPDLIREHTRTDFSNFQLGAIIGFITSVIRSMFDRGD